MNGIVLNKKKLYDHQLVRLFADEHRTEEVDVLQLYDNRLTKEAIIFMSTRKWHNLKLLNLNMNKIGDLGWKTLSKMPVHNLKILHIVDNNVSDIGVSYLSKAQMPLLQEIYIGDNCWREGVTQIGKGNFKKLNCISLSPYGGNEISKLGYFGCQRLVLSDWREAKCIFLPKIQIRSRQKNYIQEICKNRFTNNKFYCQFC